MILAATKHNDTPYREAMWQEVQRRTAELSPKGKYEVVDSGHYIQIDKPEAVIGAVISIAAETGADTSACRRH